MASVTYGKCYLWHKYYVKSIMSSVIMAKILWQMKLSRINFFFNSFQMLTLKLNSNQLFQCLNLFNFFLLSSVAESCQGKCGDVFNKNQVCQCNFNCASFNNCCDDFSNVCSSTSSSSARPPAPSSGGARPSSPPKSGGSTSAARWADLIKISDKNI